MNIDDIKARCEAAKSAIGKDFSFTLSSREMTYEERKALLDMLIEARHDEPKLLSLLSEKDKEIESLKSENERFARHGGKYIKIAEERYKMFEKATERAEKAEAERDKAIEDLKISCFCRTCAKNCPLVEKLAKRDNGVCPDYVWRGKDGAKC